MDRKSDRRGWARNHRSSFPVASAATSTSTNPTTSTLKTSMTATTGTGQTSQTTEEAASCRPAAAVWSSSSSSLVAVASVDAAWLPDAIFVRPEADCATLLCRTFRQSSSQTFLRRRCCYWRCCQRPPSDSSTPAAARIRPFSDL